ncbi:MAG: o-succinylbenzoate--CoA ligase [Alicyclobacillus sp.]|nr:o-succinylbenzoate--CoA ligase [Alicyclobacillus sp.]
MQLDQSDSHIRPVPDWLAHHAAARPNRMAVEHADGKLTYAALWTLANQVRRGLMERDIRPGDRVGLAVRHGLTYAVALHGVMQAGAIVVPLNLRLTPPEISWQLGDAGVALVLTDAAHHGWMQAAAAEGDRSVATWDLERTLRDDGGFGEPRDTSACTVDVAAGDRMLDLSAIHALVYTSGTTGLPKGVQLTYHNHLSQALASAVQVGLDLSDRWLAPMPLYHVGGLNVLMRSLIYGTTAVLHDRFDPAAVNRALAEDAITLVSVVPTMLQRMLADPGRRPYHRALRCVLLGGSAAPEGLLRRCQTEGIPVAQSYGMTETDSQVATLHPADGLRKLGSSGRPLFPSRIRIDVDGRPGKPGEVGEILVQGPTVTTGYWGRPDSTASALRGGWLHTGDVGWLDEEGYLYVLDRRSDLIVSGGENVYPAEVERVLRNHPAVAEAAVVGKRDPEWGQVPVAFVVPAAPQAGQGSDAVAAEVLRYCEAQLARYKVPKEVFWRTDLPRNASGKLLRRQLVEWLEQNER